MLFVKTEAVMELVPLGVFPGEHVGAFQKWLAWGNMSTCQKLGLVPLKCRLNKINPIKGRKLVATVSKVADTALFAVCLKIRTSTA